MAGLTGYLISSGVDLSYVFQNGSTVADGNYKLSNGSALVFLTKSGLNVVSNTGYITSTGQDLSALFEPRSIFIQNYNFASPNVSATSQYYTSMNGTINGWTFYGSTAVGYGYATTNPWNQVAFTGQYAILQQLTSYPTLYPEVYQVFALFPMNYKLSFSIIGRNPSSSYYSSSQICNVFANTKNILQFSNIGSTSWTIKSVVFTGSFSTNIKFTTGASTVESSYLITNVNIIVA
jgi:hypothetical protein